MSGFVVPFSSPPSTPDSRGRLSNGFSFKPGRFDANPSTTPAGPPSTASFTPAGPPPPSSLFGNPQYSKQTQNKLLFDSNRSLYSSPGLPLPSGGQDMIDEGGNEEHSQEYSDESEERNMDLDASNNLSPPFATSLSTSQLEPLNSSAGDLNGSFVLDETPRGTKRSRGGAAISRTPFRHTSRQTRSKRDSSIPAIAKDMATQMGLPELVEPPAFILASEDQVRQLHTRISSDTGEFARDSEISGVAEQLYRIWHSYRIKDLDVDNAVALGIGKLPDDSEPSHYRATSLATLLLQLHHPPAARGMQAPAMSRHNRYRFRAAATSRTSQDEYRPTAIPKVLLDWLDQNHQPYDAVIEQIFTWDPNPTAHEGYWDMILALTIRGRLSEIIHFFKKSQFQHALTAKDDGQTRVGYHGMMLKNVDTVIKRAVQVLETSPTLNDGDWDIAGPDWLLFRKRIEQAMIDLTTFAEGRDRDIETAMPMFEAANFGIKPADPNISRSARKAESQVPWSVYQNLKIMYGILLGQTTEIVSSAQDWIEATIGLAAWWDGEEDDEIAVDNVAATRRSLMMKQTRESRFVDINPPEAYLRRLAFAFGRIMEDENEGLFKINSINPIEVGLASIFEGDVDGIIGLLRGWSLPVASAVAEIGSFGGWYNTSPSNGMMDEFDESDLLVLSSCSPRQSVTTLDSILIDYAEKLVDIGSLGNTDENAETQEGWELSAQIYSRLQDTKIAEKRLLSLIQSLPLESVERVNKVVHTCRMLGVEDEGLKIAERYADSIAENTDDYGTAIMYYARAHSHKKVKIVFDLLISLSIVQSMAFPPISSMDDTLRRLLSKPHDILDNMALEDKEAARMLHFSVTGYATLRRFYNLRDEEGNTKEEPQRTVLRPLARKRAAAAALIAVISSAADNIFGGLFDETRGSVVHVDGLMVLLGEALVFINHDPPILSRAHKLALLAAIESLETVSPKVYKQCEECFLATITSFRDNQISPSPRQMMRKTVSSLTCSSSFSLVGSELLADSMTSGGGKGSMVKVGGRRDKPAESKDEVKRGWDWRKGTKGNVEGNDVLRILRLGLAKDMARDWIDGAR